MEPDKKYKKLIEDIQKGKLKTTEAVQKIKNLSFEQLSYARIDHNRADRKGYPEVIFGKGKTAGEILNISGKIFEQSRRVLITRIGEDKYKKIEEDLPGHEYFPKGRAVIVGDRPEDDKSSRPVPVVTAGTADIPVAREATATLKAMGNRVREVFDAGVSGVHRFLADVDTFKESRVLIVVAGMDGVLPSVAGGLVPCPVIAVPTSTGYGANFDGLAPLLTMLNSCAPGVTVVNIDNGFGAGYTASLINGS
ncbi:MAG: nickel pincer cofactor biosynthesis protein LarB [Elusimicrobiota bacterium]